MADLRIVDAPEIPTENITGEEKLPTGGSGNYSISLDSLADYTKTKKDLADNTSVAGKVNGVRQELDAHIEDLLNPHQVTKGQIGLGNVDNTADADKPVSNSTQAAIISAVAPKADKTYVDNQLSFKANKADVYTKSETYTKQESSDLVNNSISTALTPVNSSLDLAKRGIANRYDSSLTYNSGERVVLANGDIVKSTVDRNVNNPNVDMTGWVKTDSISQIFDESGLSQQVINNKLSQLVITPEYFGAVSGEADSSNALNNAIVFCSANNYVLDGRGKSYNANSLVLKDNTHIKRISINSNLYDTMNSVITTDYGTLAPLKNITLDTVYIEGKRELHTNVDAAMDGGRCAVLIRRPIDGLRIINSKLNNAVTDGLMLFPVDWAITESDWFSFVKNVQVVNTDLQWNGRWGCSADSVDGFLFENVRAKYNGLDVAGGGAYTTGKSARLMDGKHYGGAIDIEEYHGFSHSKNITLHGGDYTQNAAASLLMQRTGAITEANRNITLDNLQMDFGSINEAYPNKSISIGGYSTTNTELSYRNLVIKNCNFGNGIAEFIGCDTTYLSELFDITATILTYSVVNTDKYYNFTLSDSYSNFYDVGYARKDKTAYFVGRHNEETTVNFYNENTIGKSVSLNIFDDGAVKSGLRFTKQDAGCDMHFLNGADPILTVRKYGSIVPAVDNIAQVGESSHRISKFYGHAMSISSLGVFSDNNAAKTGGLVAGDFYRTSTGQVMVVF